MLDHMLVYPHFLSQSAYEAEDQKESCAGKMWKPVHQMSLGHEGAERQVHCLDAVSALKLALAELSGSGLDQRLSRGDMGIPEIFSSSLN